MIFFGHLGMGNALSRPFRRGLSLRWILLGTIAPDLLDKSIYYGCSYWTGKHGAELGLISGTRTFGHTAIILLFLSAIAFAFKSRRLAALSIGISTHLLLDGLSDYYFMMTGVSQIKSAILWPISGMDFPIIPYHSIQGHISSWNQPFLIVSELLGIALLAFDYSMIFAKSQRGPMRM